MSLNRQIEFQALKGYKTRIEQFGGKDHLVVPVVALVEGVVHAMNASMPEFVPASEFSKAPHGWNGRPIYLGHPVREGRPVSGNTPDVIEQGCIGRIFNTKILKNKLTMEAWIDIERATEKAPTLLSRVEGADPIEISVGVFTSADDSKGTFGGKAYEGAWFDIMPDHLALLPEGDLGACSVEAGCGVRAAKANSKGAVVNGGLLNRVMSAFRGAMSTEDMTNNDLLRKLAEALRGKYPNTQYADQYYPATNPDHVIFTCSMPSTATGPESGMGYQYKTYEQAFTLDADGVVTLTGEATEVEPVMRYEPVNRAASDAEPKTAASGKPACSCQHPTPEEKALMKTKQERVTALIGKGKTFEEADRAMLEAASDEQITRFEAASEAAPAEPTKTENPAAAAPAAVVPVAAAPVPEVKDETKVLAAPTFDQMLAAASPEVRESIESGIRTAKAKKDSTIAALKATGRCEMTDAQLGAKTQVELDQLVALAGSNVRAAIDFSVLGGPKDHSKTEEVPAPADLGASIRAAREKK